MNSGDGEDLRCTGDESSDMDEDRCETRFRQKEKGHRKSCGRKSKQEKHSDPSDSEKSDYNDDRKDKPDRK